MREDDGNNQRENAIHKSRKAWGHQKPGERAETHSVSQPFSSVQFSRSVVSNSLRPHESQHARPPCPSPTPRVYSNSCPSSRWCHPAVSSSAIPFSSCPQSLPASGSFPMSQLFAWGGQSIGVSASASVLPMNTQDWSPKELSLLTPRFQTSSFQNCETIHFCCFCHPVYDIFLWQPQETNRQAKFNSLYDTWTLLQE